MKAEDIALKKKIDAISPSYCIAKWMHTTLHLEHGRTQSCYLPPSHIIPKEGLLENPSQLHNTEFKKFQRKLMLAGERPPECSHCWAMEDLPGNNLSDRVIRARQNWAQPYLETVPTLPWDKNITPSYIEVSFSNTCNLRCAYCSPHISSAWMEEIKKFGAYKLSEGEHQNLAWMEAQGLLPLAEEGNLYVEAFWKWWPEIYLKLKIFRITGGEPLLSPNTYKILDWIVDNPHEELELDINTNLSVPRPIVEKFFDKVASIIETKKIKKFRLHTSLDAWGKRAEYIRSGMQFPYFLGNIHRFLEKIPKGDLFFISTFSALSMGGMSEFLDKMKELRENYPTRRIGIDFAHLTAPDFLSAQIFPDSFTQYFDIWLEKMRINHFPEDEIEKIQRIQQWIQKKPEPQQLVKLRKDFSSFFREYDRRRGIHILEVFPELSCFCT